MKLWEESVQIGEQAPHMKSREAGVKADTQIARSLSAHSSDCRRQRAGKVAISSRRAFHALTDSGKWFVVWIRPSFWIQCLRKHWGLWGERRRHTFPSPDRRLQNLWKLIFWGKKSFCKFICPVRLHFALLQEMMTFCSLPSASFSQKEPGIVGNSQLPQPLWIENARRSVRKEKGEMHKCGDRTRGRTNQPRQKKNVPVESFSISCCFGDNGAKKKKKVCFIFINKMGSALCWNGAVRVSSVP